MPPRSRWAPEQRWLSSFSPTSRPSLTHLPLNCPPPPCPMRPRKQRMLDAARAYAVQTWSRLPNFFVTRVTTRFDDTPQVLVKGDWPVRVGLHPVGNTSARDHFSGWKGSAGSDSGKDCRGKVFAGTRSAHLGRIRSGDDSRSCGHVQAEGLVQPLGAEFLGTCRRVSVRGAAGGLALCRRLLLPRRSGAGRARAIRL